MQVISDSCKNCVTRRLLQLAIAFVFVAALLCGPVHAHNMNMFAVVEAGAIQGEVFGRGATPFADVKVTAFGPAGDVLAETRTDDSGKFSLVPTRRCQWRLVATTDDGHQAEYTVPAVELPSSLPDDPSGPAAPSSEPPAETHDVPATAPQPATAASDPPADAVADLGRQLAALRRELNELRNELRWQDIVGGLGYILGLMGLSFYFLGVQKQVRDQPPPSNPPGPAATRETAGSGNSAETSGHG